MKKDIKILKTETYIKSLEKLKDKEVINSVEKKVNKLKENVNIALPMKYQHNSIYEIVVRDKYRVYCIKKEKKSEEIIIILFILGKVIHHKYNYQNSAEYQKMFEELKCLEREFDESIKTKKFNE